MSRQHPRDCAQPLQHICTTTVFHDIIRARVTAETQGMRTYIKSCLARTLHVRPSSKQISHSKALSETCPVGNVPNASLIGCMIIPIFNLPACPLFAIGTHLFPAFSNKLSLQNISDQKPSKRIVDSKKPKHRIQKNAVVRERTCPERLFAYLETLSQLYTPFTWHLTWLLMYEYRFIPRNL